MNTKFLAGIASFIGFGIALHAFIEHPNGPAGIIPYLCAMTSLAAAILFFIVGRD